MQRPRRVYGCHLRVRMGVQAPYTTGTVSASRRLGARKRPGQSSFVWRCLRFVRSRTDRLRPPLPDPKSRDRPSLDLIMCYRPAAPPFGRLLRSLLVPGGSLALGAYERGRGRSRTRTNSSFNNRCLRRPLVPCPRPHVAAQYTNVVTNAALPNPARRNRGRQPTRPIPCHPERADCPRGQLWCVQIR